MIEVRESVYRERVLKCPGGIGDSVVEKTVTYVGDKTNINRRGKQVGRMDLVNGSTSDLVEFKPF